MNEISFDASDASNWKKQVARSTISGIKGYLRAEINLLKARTADQKASAQSMREQKQQELVNTQNWFELQISTMNARSQQTQAEKKPEDEASKLDADYTQRKKKLGEFEDIYGRPPTDTERNSILGYEGDEDVDPLKQQKAERELAEERVNTRHGIKPGDEKPEGWLGEVMAEERHIRKQAEPAPEAQTETEETNKKQIDAIARIGKAGELAKALVDGKTVDEFIGEDLSDKEKEQYETEMQVAGDAPVMPETTTEVESSKLQAEMKRVRALAKKTGETEEETLVRLGTLAAKDKTIEQMIETNISAIETFLEKYPDGNFSALQLFQAATGQAISANSNSGLSDYEETVMGIQRQMDANPTLYPPDGPDAIERAHIWKGKQIEYQAMMEAQNAGNYTNNPKIAPRKYRESPLLKGQSNATIVEKTNKNLRNARTIMSARIANSTPKSHEFVSGQIDNIISDKINDELIPEEYRVQEAAEDLMLIGAEGGVDSRQKVDKYLAAKKLGRKMIAAEKRFIELAQEGLKTGFKGGNLQALLKHLARSYDTEFSELNVQLTEAYTTYLYEKSGKQTHQYEVKKIEGIFPRLGMTVEDNLAIITGWYGTLNGEISGYQNAVIGNDTAEMLGPTFRIGGYSTKESGYDEYIFGYENGKVGDPAHDAAYERMGQEPEMDEELDEMYEVYQEDGLTKIRQRTEGDRQSSEDLPTEPEVEGDAEPETRAETREPEPIDPDDSEPVTDAGPNNNTGEVTEVTSEAVDKAEAVREGEVPAEGAQLTSEWEQWSEGVREDIIADTSGASLDEQLDVVRGLLAEEGLSSERIEQIIERIRGRVEEPNVSPEMRNAIDPSQIRAKMNPPKTAVPTLSEPVSKAVKSHLRHVEGFRSSPYDDTGQQAIGYGFKMERWGLTGKKNMTREEADKVLDRIIDTTYREAKQVFSRFDSYDEQRQFAIVELIYNLGLTRFSEFDKTIGFIEEEKWAEAAAEIMNSNAAQTKGLTSRYLSIARRLQSGGNPSHSKRKRR